MSFNLNYQNYDTSLDRMARIALKFISTDFKETNITFEDMENKITQFSRYFKDINLQKGDHVFLFLERCPEMYFAFLACVNIGVVPSPLFAAFQEKALGQRLLSANPKLVLTNKNLSSRLNKFTSRMKVICLEDIKNDIEKQKTDILSDFSEENEPLFMLYTSSTGNTPVSGIVIPRKALNFQIETAKTVLDLKPDDTYWCTADPGWVTGTVYGILVPYYLGVTQVVFSGRFQAESWFKILSENKISVWYTAPTALRLLQEQEKLMINYNFSNLRHLCSVGEALPKNTIEWCEKYFGQPVHDTWWQTETGAIMIANYPHGKIVKGSIGLPVPGVKAAIIDDQGKELGDNVEGNLAFCKGWPSMLIDVYKNKAHFDQYFRGSWYVSGDRAKRDTNGYFWFSGRADDIIKTSGERVSPVEVEGCLVEHPAVAEAGVVGLPDQTRGQIIKAFLVLKPGVIPKDSLKAEIQEFVKTHLAGHAYPREIEFLDKLPKNKAGKIIRRILKARELNLPLGDTSTLE